MLTIEITETMVKDAGEKFQGKMHTVSAKLILKDVGTVVFEQTFSENHKGIHSMPETMEKIRVQMNETKKRIETELALKVEAEKEIPAMLINMSKEVK